MKTTRTRKLLRLSTFIAVSAGLAVGTHAMAATPADQAQAPTELAQQETDQQPTPAEEGDQIEVDVDLDDEADVDDEAEFDEEAELEVPQQNEVDYPSDIESFADFIEEHRTEGIENVPEYTYEGLQEMSDAMEEVIPGESRLFRDRTPEHTQVFEDQHDAWEDRIDELSDEERPDFAAVAHNLLTDGAQWFVTVQESEYPALTDHVQQLTETADELDPEVDINMQGDAVQAYFESALTTIQAFYIEQEEDPLAASPTGDLSLVSYPSYLAEGGEHHDDPAIEDDPMMEEDPAMEEDPEAQLDTSPEVQTYRDSVTELDAEVLTGEELRNMVLSSMRNLEVALGTFIEDEQPMQEDDPMQEEDPGEIEGAQYDGTEDDPMQQEDPMQEEDPMTGQELTEEDLQELREEHEQLRENIQDLEASIDDEDEFGGLLEESMENAANLLTNIQETQFPQFEQEAEEIRNVADEIDGGQTIDEQSDVIMEFFNLSANALEAMDQQREDVPVALLF